MEGEERPWDALPTLALVNIFCKTTIKDRMRTLPMVCSSWNHASRDPLCWASMIADSHYSPAVADDAFVKDSYGFDDDFVDPFDGKRSSNARRGVPRLKTIIERAGGGAAITSLYIFPFLTSVFCSPNDNALLRLIAHRCPNLKHLSFHRSYRASKETVLEVIRSCKKLELIDFSDSPYFIASVLEEMGRCCLNLRGIRVATASIGSPEVYVIATSFPWLKLLNMSNTPLGDEDLLTIVFGCQELQYLDITGCWKLVYDLDIIRRASVKIAEFLYDREVGYFDDPEERYYLDEYDYYDYADSGYW